MDDKGPEASDNTTGKVLKTEDELLEDFSVLLERELECELREHLLEEKHVLLDIELEQLDRMLATRPDYKQDHLARPSRDLHCLFSRSQSPVLGEHRHFSSQRDHLASSSRELECIFRRSQSPVLGEGSSTMKHRHLPRPNECLDDADRSLKIAPGNKARVTEELGLADTRSRPSSRELVGHAPLTHQDVATFNARPSTPYVSEMLQLRETLRPETIENEDARGGLVSRQPNTFPRFMLGNYYCSNLSSILERDEEETKEP